jgi:hypothetical protein
LPPLPPHDDMVGPPFSPELDGCVLDYRCVTGSSSCTGWSGPAGIHVALIIDLERSELHSAAMMPPNQWEYFDVAEVTEVTRQ